MATAGFEERYSALQTFVGKSGAEHLKLVEHVVCKVRRQVARRTFLECRRPLPRFLPRQGHTHVKRELARVVEELGGEGQRCGRGLPRTTQGPWPCSESRRQHRSHSHSVAAA